MISIRIPGYSGFATLESPNGSIVGDRLSGDFQIAFRDERTGTVNFTGAADQRVRVTARSGEYVLAEAQAIAFPIDVELSGRAVDPRVHVTELTIVFAAQKTRASLVFSAVSLSLIAGQAPETGRPTITSPSGSGHGMTQTPAHATRDPESQRIGFPIIPNTDGWEIRLGRRDNQFHVSHVPGATIQIGKDATVGALIGDPSGKPRTRARLIGAAPDESATSRIRILNSRAAGMELVAFSATNVQSDAFAQTLAVEGGLLTIEAIHGDRFEAHALDTAAARLAALRGDASQFRLFLKMPETAGQQVPGDAAQLAFVDDRVVNDSGYKRLVERFHGLTVEGLSTVRSARECLDCSHAAFTLRMGARFELKAGLPLTFLDGSSTPSPKLIPKMLPSGERRVDLMVGAMHLSSTGSFTIDTAIGLFSIVDPVLQGRPNGPGASASDPSSTAYSSWILQSQSGLSLALDRAGVRPAAADWASHFDYAADQAFRLVEQPGAGFTMRRLPARLARQGRGPQRTVDRTEVTQIRDANGKDYVAVSALCATLSYLAVRHFQGSDGETFVGQKDIEFRLRLLDVNSGALETYAKGVAPGDVRIEWSSDSASSAALEDFIEDNIKDGNPNPDKVLFPFHDALSVVLREKQKDGSFLNAFQIALLRKSTAHPLFAMDFSETKDLGLDWQALARDDTPLWPTKLKSDGKRKDPSDVGWKGVFLRDMPLNINLPSTVLALLKDWPYLLKLLDSLNTGLLLDYGWRDESGPTWSSRLAPSQPIQISPDLIKHFISIQLEKATFQGAAGRAVRASATVDVSLPFIDGQDPPRLVGDFEFTLGGENPIGRVMLRAGANDTPISTTIIPGFKKVALAGITTDMKTVRADMDLYPSDKLKAFMDVFDLPDGKPFEASLNFDLKSDKPSGLTITTKQEIHTKLLGKWPLAIQSFRLDVDPFKLHFDCQLELGFPTIRSVGAKITLIPNGQDWDFSISLNEVSANLGVGDVDAEIKLGWRNDAKVKNEFWGTLELKGGPIKMAQKVQMRVGASGGRPYWIAGTNLPNVSLGVVKLLDPVLLIGRGAELQGLAAAIVDPSKNLKILRDSKSGKEDEDWLKDWQPSPSIGTVFAASGFLSFDSSVAGSTKDKGDSEDGKYLTNLVFTDNGLLRIDGWFKLMSSDDLLTRIVFGLNTQNQIISAGMQLPRLKIPPTGKTEIEVYPGFAYFSFSYGGVFFFKYSLGWPELKQGSDIERDWNQSTKVYVADAWPINTFWGGSLVEFHAGKSLTFGLALRAGWTQSYPGIGVKGVASAEAELGIALGGVLLVDFGTPQDEARATPFAAQLPLTAARLLATQTDTERPLDDVEEAQGETPTARVPSAYEFAQSYIAALRSEAHILGRFPQLGITAQLYGDIWGRGSAEFLGVTIASVAISAYARFKVAGNTYDGITSMRSITGFSVEVTILCVHHKADVEVDIWVIRR